MFSYKLSCINNPPARLMSFICGLHSFFSITFRVVLRFFSEFHVPRLMSSGDRGDRYVSMSQEYLKPVHSSYLSSAMYGSRLIGLVSMSLSEADYRDDDNAMMMIGDDKSDGVWCIM